MTRTAGFLLAETLLALVLASLIALALARLVTGMHRLHPRLDDATALAKADAARTHAAFRSHLRRADRITVADAALPDDAVWPSADWLASRPDLTGAPSTIRQGLVAAGFPFRDEPGCTVFLHTATGRSLGVLTAFASAADDVPWQVVRFAPADDSPRGFRWRHPQGPRIWHELAPDPPHTPLGLHLDLPDPNHPASRTRHVLPPFT